MKGKKSFNVRLDHDLWIFLKKEAIRQETSMSKLLESAITKMRDKREKKVLTTNNTIV